MAAQPRRRAKRGGGYFLPKKYLLIQNKVRKNCRRNPENPTGRPIRFNPCIFISLEMSFRDKRMINIEINIEIIVPIGLDQGSERE